MEFTSAMPFAAAIARLESKTPVASRLRTEEWSQVQLGLRDRAFFSAAVESVKTLATMQSKLDEALRLPSGDATHSQMDRSKFIAEMRQALGAAPGDNKGFDALTDITSTKRLGLIFDFQIEDAREFGRWQAGQDPDLLDAFPAQELIRVEDREAKRDWPERWAEAGGKFYAEAGDRMIAVKGDPVWAKLSRFGRPWPPFDFGSGMGLEDIDREEAEALGVIARGAIVAPDEADFNQGLQASVPEASPAILEAFKDLFGDQVEATRDGKIVWQGQRVQRLYESALADDSVKWSLDLGGATANTIAAAQKAGVDLTGARLVLDADHIRHADQTHGTPGKYGPGTGERRADQRPLTALDFQLVPHVWRTPDSVRPGDLPGTLEFSADIAGRRALVAFDRRAKSGAWSIKTLYVKKEGGAP